MESIPSALPEYIDAAVPLPLFGTYTYRVPETFQEKIALGKRVLVPFGRRRIIGFIVALPAAPPENCQIKALLDVLDQKPIFPPAMIPFFQWIAGYYLYPLGEVILTALPAGSAQVQEGIFEITPAGKSALSTQTLGPLQRAILESLMGEKGTCKQLGRRLARRLTPAQLQPLVERGWLTRHAKKVRAPAEVPRVQMVHLTAATPPPGGNPAPARDKIVAALETRGEVSMAELRALSPSAPRIVKALAASGQVRITAKPIYRDPFGEPIVADTPPVLNREQAAAVSAVSACWGKGYSPFLLAGVTGSGKTEVYLRLAAEALENQLSVIVLVPEIALISQAARRFRARFGEGVAILHSGLTLSDRRAQWRRIADRQIPIVIGARSAIFAPVTRLGLVVVDEEHDASYKQESGLRYNARDLALVRARQQGAVALLGSATPSVQSYFNVETEKFRELTLTRRIARRPLPAIEVVDLRQIRDLRGTARFFSPQLIRALNTTLERGEQALIFLNRRGFANFPICGNCGKPLTCPHCDISLTFHQKINAHRCHWCGFNQPATLACPHCGALEIKNLGLGTERLESALTQHFPQARIGRMDRDTTRRKGRLIQLLNDLKARRIDIMVGTQMVTKGHNFPHITLVGVICADMSLNIPDFRSGERTFQLLAQVAGRAGRGSAAGQVILQTYAPDHFTILAAQAQDFQRFYHQEIVFRRALNYPPFSRLIQLKISGTNARRTAERAQAMGRLCYRIRAESAEMEPVEILGPIEAGIARIANRHRWQILLKAASATILNRFARKVLFSPSRAAADREVRVTADVDPYLMV